MSHADAEHHILEAGKARGIPYAEIISTGINSGLASGIIKGEANTIDHMHNAQINNTTHANAPIQHIPQQQDDDIVQYLNRGEVGDAELLAKECAGSYLFDHSANKWLRRDGYVWREDSTRTIEYCIPTTLAAKYCYRAAEASATNNMALAKAFEERTKKLRDRQRIINVLKLAETQIDMACTGNEFDQLSGCLPCLNGIYQFNNGTFREGQPKDYVRTFIPHSWTGMDTGAPLFVKFIEQVFPDVALRDFVQRLFGYSILGTGAERILPIFWGIGANGKSTLIEIIRYVLGDFAATTPAETLLATQSHSDGAPQPFLFRLRGKRFVATSETEETRRLNASLVKSLTGMDTLCVRTLHGKPIEFTPRFLTLLSTNHRPRVNADDQAVWDRLLLVPFNARFVDNPQGENEYPRIANIIEQFKAEASGILAWLVKGAHSYMRDGLCAPEMVRMATSEYRTNEDTLQQFLDECTTNGDNSRRTRASELYEAYKGWAERNGYGVLSIRTLGDRMIQKQIPRGRDANGVVYPGLIIRSMPAPAPKGGNYYQSSVGCRIV